MALKDIWQNVFGGKQYSEAAPSKETVDPLGQMAPTTEEPKTLTVRERAIEQGVTGDDINYGYIRDEMNAELVGRSGAMKYDEMRRTDAQVNASLLTMELPIRATKWQIEAAANKDGKVEQSDQDVADFVHNCLFEWLDQSRDDTLRQILTLLPFGYSVFEKVMGMKKYNGRDYIYLKKLGFRKQKTIERWELDDGTPGVKQILPAAATYGQNKGQMYAQIPAEKLVIFSHRREGDVYTGVSVLRSAYKHWYIKDNLYRFDAIRHERQGVGIPVIYMPKNATANDKNFCQALVQNIRATEQTGIVMPGPKSDGWEFEYADIKASQSTDFEKSIEHHNREIVKNVLAQFLELGNTQSGSRSLGDSQVGYFLMGLEAVAKYICDTINKYIVKQLVDLNFDVTDYPKLTFQAIYSQDNKAMVDMVVALIGSGAITADKTLQLWLRETIGLPKQDEDEPQQQPADAQPTDQQPDMPDDVEQDVADDAELPDNTDEIDSLEKELEQYEEMDTLFAQTVFDIAETFEEAIETYSFRKPMSEETKRKISEALKAYYGRQGSDMLAVSESMKRKIAELDRDVATARSQADEGIRQIKSGIEALRTKAKSLPKGKAGKKQREEIKRQVEGLKAEAKRVREAIKHANEYRAEKKDRLKEIYRQNKRDIAEHKRIDKQTAKEMKRQQKIAERAARKVNRRSYAELTASKQDHSCDHDADIFFDNDYFTNLSSIINNDLIKQINQ